MENRILLDFYLTLTKLNLQQFPASHQEKHPPFSGWSAEGGTWTLMSVSSLRPERSASANSATSAIHLAGEFYLKG